MSVLFIVSMVVEAIYGFGFIFIPGIALGPYGVSLDAAATTLARLLGTSLVTFGIMLFLALRSDNGGFRKGMVIGLFFYNIVVAIVSAIATLGGVMNSLGWSVVGVHLIFAVWFGFFFVKQAVTRK